jgi:signal transduction histidine kinase
LNELQSQNRLLRQRSRFTTGGVAMILGIGAILVFLVLNSRWNRKLQIKNMQLQRERNVVVAQNKQLAIERDHAEAASKAKTAFMQSMTHEIRTPLNAISGFTQVLTMKDIELPDSERMDFCERIQENTGLLTTILDNLLLISDMESRSELPEPETCVVSAVATQALDMVRSLVANTVTLDCQCELPVDQTIDSYPRMIHIVLAKLLENAAKFTTVGSITLKVSEQDSALHFSVTDTGPGIPPDKKDYIFERFTKLDNFVQGTGLGLTVARMIAERLGGTLTLDTEYKNGSKFDFILPI